MTPRQERGRSPTGGGARTATALPNRVSRRRQGRWAEQESQGAAPPLMPTLGTRDIAAALNRAGALGHRVTACGTRPASATTARRPHTTEVVARWPHRYVAATEIDVHTHTLPEHGRRTSPLTRSRRRAGSPPSTPGRRPVDAHLALAQSDGVIARTGRDGRHRSAASGPRPARSRPAMAQHVRLGEFGGLNLGPDVLKPSSRRAATIPQVPRPSSEVAGRIDSSRVAPGGAGGTRTHGRRIMSPLL